LAEYGRDGFNFWVYVGKILLVNKNAFILTKWTHFVFIFAFFNPKKKQKMKYPSDFSNWTTQAAHDAFGLKAVKSLPSMTAWDAIQVEINEYDKQRLVDLLKYAAPRAAFWSEGDIKMKLLGPALVIANIDNESFSTFSEVTVRAQLPTIKDGDINVSGRPDLMIATGEFQAKLPYFCMQEYKPKKHGSDPRGQTLVALMAARQLNQKMGKPQNILYGAFSAGRDWTFLTLENQAYTLSRGYFLDEQNDLEEVIRRLRALKEIIYQIIK
jgi:hypothetical protein